MSLRKIEELSADVEKMVTDLTVASGRQTHVVLTLELANHMLAGQLETNRLLGLLVDSIHPGQPENDPGELNPKRVPPVDPKGGAPGK